MKANIQGYNLSEDHIVKFHRIQGQNQAAKGDTGMWLVQKCQQWWLHNSAMLATKINHVRLQ